MFVSKQDRVVNVILYVICQHLSEEYRGINMNYGDIYKIEHKRPEDSHFANNES